MSGVWVDAFITCFRSFRLVQPQPVSALANHPTPRISRDRLVKVADSLPGAPKVLTELENLLRDANSELDMITALLRRDVSLTARIIRIANGVVYNRGEPVGVLEDALAKVGFSEVFRLISIASMLQLLDLPLRFYPATPKQMRENALFSALLMETLAPDVGIESRTAYTTGLLRGVGRTVLDLTAQRELRYFPVPPLPATGLIEWEMMSFGMTSFEAGGHVLKAWRFPADVFVAVRDQLLIDLSVDPLPNAKLLHVTLAAVNAAEYGLVGDDYCFDQHVFRACADLQLTEERVAGALEQAGRRFERMRPMLG
jgi:HD-like signal output (HDOD) protein